LMLLRPPTLIGIYSVAWRCGSSVEFRPTARLPIVNKEAEEDFSNNEQAALSCLRYNTVYQAPENLDSLLLLPGLQAAVQSKGN